MKNITQRMIFNTVIAAVLFTGITWATLELGVVSVNQYYHPSFFIFVISFVLLFEGYFELPKIKDRVIVIVVYAIFGFLLSSWLFSIPLVVSIGITIILMVHNAIIQKRYTDRLNEFKQKEMKNEMDQSDRN